MELQLRPDPDDPDEMLIHVDAVVDGEHERLLFDTGARRTSIRSIPQREALPALGAADGRGISGAASGGRLVQVRTLVAGALRATYLVVELVGADSEAPTVLGMDVIGAHVCEFQFEHERLSVDAPAPADGTLLPLKTSQGGQPLVDVHFARASTTVAAVWDTGASITVVDRAWFAANPGVIDLDGGADSGQDSSGKTVESATGTLAACVIGGVEFAATPCVVVDFSQVNAHLAQPLEVILGLPVLTQATWWLDFPGHRWHVRRP